MTKIHKARMRKLIAFLRVMPIEKFNFGTVHRATECGTVGCAIGWTPKVFPELVKWEDGWLRMAEERGYIRVGALLFGISEQIAMNVFSPSSQRLVSRKLPTCYVYATPKQVASMLEKFLALVESGEVKA